MYIYSYINFIIEIVLLKVLLQGPFFLYRLVKHHH